MKIEIKVPSDDNWEEVTRIVIVRCPYCKSNSVKKRGVTSNGLQKFVCGLCNRHFQENTIIPRKNAHPMLGKQKVSHGVSCPYCNGTHIRKNGKNRDKKENKKYRKKPLDLDDAWRIAQGHIDNGRLFVGTFKNELRIKGFRPLQLAEYPKQIQNKLDKEKKK